MQKYFLQHKMVMVFLLVVLAIFSFGSGINAATNEGPKEQLEKSVNKILNILQSENYKGSEKKDKCHQLVLNVVNDMFDFREMAKSSLGKNWNNLSPEEQENFVGLFTNLIEQRYIGKIDSYNNQKVVYKKQRVKGNKAIIYTDIIDKDLEIPIDYRLKEKQGKWLIYDMKIENVSLIANYRRDFDSIIRKEKFAGLMEKITKLIEKPETKN